MLKNFAILLFSIFLFFISSKSDAKVRLTYSNGFSLKNDFSNKTAVVYGAGFHLSYPISNNSKINTEIGAASWYNYYTLTDIEMQTLRFGLAIRVYFNLFEKFLPYFTHDILSQITYLSKLEGSAETYSIILGLGAKILKINSIPSAFFAEVTYSRFSLGYFEIERNGFSFLSFNMGVEF